MRDEDSTVGNAPKWIRALKTAVAVGALTVLIGLTVNLIGHPTDTSVPAAAATPGMPTASTEPATPPGATPEPDSKEPADPAKPLKVTKPASGPVSADKRAEVTRASTAATSVVESLNQIGQRADGSAAGVDLVATGFVLGELQAQAQQQRELGYRQIGEAKITGVRAEEINLTGRRPTMTLNVCVDVSGIDVRDAGGKSLKDALYNPGRPVKHVYGAVFEDSVWKIASHDIPDEQNCEKVR